MDGRDRTELGQTVFGKVVLLANRFHNLNDRVFSELTLKQWFLLILILRIEEEDVTIQRLAESSGTSRQNVSQILSILEEKGFVVIKRSPVDGRSRVVELTKKSFSFFVRNDTVAQESILGLFNGIDDGELQEFEKTLDVVLENVSALANDEDA